MKVRFRKLWLSLHRWLGLTAGLLFVLLGLTGSLLVFDHAIDERLNPELLLTPGSGATCSPGQIVAAAEQAFATSHARATAVSASSPRVADGVWLVWFQSGTPDKPTWTQVCVDPYTAEALGQRVGVKT